MIYCQHIYVCEADRCGATHMDKITTMIEWEPMRPSLPEGWHRVGHRMYCAAHQIALRVDGVSVVDCR